MHRARNIVILATAVILLLIAVGLEHPYFQVLRTANGSSVIFNGKSLVSLLKELAFALFIAWLIIISIETQARNADRQTAEELRKQIAHDVFKGVFSRDLPSTYVDTVITAALKPNLIREYWAISYILGPLTAPKDLNEQQHADESVVLTRRISWRFKNTTDRKVVEDVHFFMPNSQRSGFISGITKFKYGSSNGELVDKIDELVSSSTDEQNSYVWRLELEARQTVECLIEDRMIKDLSDNEIFSSYYPALRAEVTCDVRLPGLNVGITGRTATPLVEVHQGDDGTSGRGETAGAILPNDSITFWWRPKTKKVL